MNILIPLSEVTYIYEPLKKKCKRKDSKHEKKCPLKIKKIISWIGKEIEKKSQQN